MDARRYQQSRTNAEEVSINNKTLPGLVILATGVILLITGLILLAAFGVPSDIANHPKRISSIIALAVGGLVCLIGIGVSIHLRSAARKEKARRKRQRREEIEQTQSTAHAPIRGHPMPYSQPTSISHPSYGQEATNARAPYQAYNGGFTESDGTYAYSTRIET